MNLHMLKTLSLLFFIKFKIVMLSFQIYRAKLWLNLAPYRRTAIASSSGKLQVSNHIQYIDNILVILALQAPNYTEEKDVTKSNWVLKP